MIDQTLEHELHLRASGHVGVDGKGEDGVVYSRYTQSNWSRQISSMCRGLTKP